MQSYKTDFSKCQIPQLIPPNNRSSRIATATTISLNFLYRFLSGGANELWGKYGGGVYVAISAWFSSTCFQSSQTYLTSTIGSLLPERTPVRAMR